MISSESQLLDRVRRIRRANVVVKVVQLDDHAADSYGGPRLREIGPALILPAVTKGKSLDAQDTLRRWHRESCPRVAESSWNIDDLPIGVSDSAAASVPQSTRHTRSLLVPLRR